MSSVVRNPFVIIILLTLANLMLGTNEGPARNEDSITRLIDMLKAKDAKARAQAADELAKLGLKQAKV